MKYSFFLFFLIIGHACGSHFLSPETSCLVVQRHVGYASPDSKFPVLATHGLNTCVGLVLYNATEKRAALAHLDASTMVESINTVIGKMRSGVNINLEAHLMGGHTSRLSKKLYSDTVELLSRANNVVLTKEYVRTGMVGKIAIDARSGHVYTNFTSNQVSEPADHSKMLDDICMSTMLYHYEPIREQKGLKF